jgi:serine/threonine protein kinase
MAPELHNKQEFDGEKVDVWSIGATTITMITSQLPYDIPDVVDSKFALLTTNLPLYLQFYQVEVCPTLCCLLGWMLQIEPEQRPTLEQILQHEYFSSIR